MKTAIFVCAIISALCTNSEAQVMIDQYGRTYVRTYSDPSGVVLGIDPSSGQSVTGYAPVLPESDPAMFGQVRPDGSVIGYGGQ